MRRRKRLKEKAYFNPVMKAVIFQLKVIKSNPNVGSLRCGDDSGQVHIVRIVVRVVGRGHCARGNVTGRRRRDSCPGQLEPFV